MVLAHCQGLCGAAGPAAAVVGGCAKRQRYRGARTRPLTPPHRACLPVLPPQAHARLKGYVKTHFEHHLKCVEKGLVDPWADSG